ncbi:MAG: aspartate-semialdehyde dehydrogenase [Dehalococcoidia bacterium]|uniref:aspartate-semialdehyde dehydrogenase n=1 Tax=Candidatus Amarobacter glycogenicus TaxID=3140699 RepID=UPI00313624C2|nr:aspartate-semialdehyde dehydrogenase [Dehalococcoidia bacterium]MBK7329609.1 aspartate-semialdehyde dehydrogenase [Dehalococcoidia bacterium]
MDAYNITVVGGAGIVGREFLKLLETRKTPVKRLRLLATARSAGKVVEFRGEKITVEETSEASFSPADDVVFLSASGSASKQYAPIAQRNGSFVIDDSSAYRMDPAVPLVIPEVNADDLSWHQGIVSQPNCTTTPMVLALAPIHRVNPLRRIVVSTYQAVAGAGSAAVDGLRTETEAALAGRHEPSGTQKREIAFNAVPQIDVFDEGGYTKEEIKMANETRKILHAPDIAISATCVRIPTFFGHAMNVWAEFERPVTPAEARELIAAARGVRLIDDPAKESYPTPMDVAGTDDVLVGRLRGDSSLPGGITLWTVTDSIRKGAATNVVQVIEEAARRGLIRR